MEYVLIARSCCGKRFLDLLVRVEFLFPPLEIAKTFRIVQAWQEQSTLIIWEDALKGFGSGDESTHLPQHESRVGGPSTHPESVCLRVVSPPRH